MAVIIVQFFSFFLSEVYGLDACERGLVFIPAVVAAGVAGNFLGGGLIDRFTRRNRPGADRARGASSSSPASALLGVATIRRCGSSSRFTAISAFGCALSGPATTSSTPRSSRRRSGPRACRCSGWPASPRSSSSRPLGAFASAGRVRLLGLPFCSRPLRLRRGAHRPAAGGRSSRWTCRNAMAAAMADRRVAPAKASGRASCSSAGTSTSATTACRCCSASTSTSRKARSSPCSAPTARASRRCCGPSADPGGVRRRHRLRRAGHHPHAAPRDRRPGCHAHARRPRRLPRVDVAENLVLGNWMNRGPR